ncbi:EutP/PduV family microcompartment system protein [Peptococcaceae bacterium 1198_IL3148]
MKKRILVVGPSKAGKSSLVNILNDSTKPLKSTQEIFYGKNTIDTPGSYIENPSMYRYLIATGQSACHVLMLIDQSRPIEVYPPGFAKSFTCPVSGVITKIDLASENAELCVEQLKRIGISKPFFRISIKDDIGIKGLKHYLLGKLEILKK